MSIVKYEGEGHDKFFCVGQALRDGWGIEWKDRKNLIGLKLKGRGKDKRKNVTITDFDFYMGMMRIHFDFGWNFLDHVVENWERAD